MRNYISIQQSRRFWRACEWHCLCSLLPQWPTDLHMSKFALTSLVAATKRSLHTLHSTRVPDISADACDKPYETQSPPRGAKTLALLAVSRQRNAIRGTLMLSDARPDASTACHAAPENAARTCFHTSHLLHCLPDVRTRQAKYASSVRHDISDRRSILHRSPKKGVCIDTNDSDSDKLRRATCAVLRQ